MSEDNEVVKGSDFGFISQVMDFVNKHPEVVTLAREIVILLTAVFAKNTNEDK